MKESYTHMSKHSFFEKAATKVTAATGSNVAFLCAVAVVLGWLITGPIFDYSDTWQLFINTGTTIVTFLMVFLIQKSQNKDALAIQLKLNELVAANELASNRLVNVEDMTEEELKVLHRYYTRLAALAMKEENIQSSHSIEEAEEIHEFKKEAEIRTRGPKKEKPQKHAV